ncbi:response regulator transcription factor [Dehalococcoidia bacterium]|nr:response regulator transcription factor [Dehalococcoidia bacterium]
MFIIAEKYEAVSKLRSGLTQRGFACSIASDGEDPVRQVVEQAPDLVLVQIDGHTGRELAQRIKAKSHLPIIALVRKERLDGFDDNLAIDDFVITPCDVTELALRIKRLLHRISDTHSGEVIRCGELVMDLGRCEVAINGKLVALTFREYELLKFLASNRGRVFTREALLNKVWGYEYYGGDRTVDVHIRRLRSKIEDSSHSFVETVRNIGYRFRPQGRRKAIP